ncbi:MAG: DUF1178 family protein [Pseudomonadota bacterium]
MIVFDLKCEHDHVFEAWFGSSSDYDAQRARGLISCPVCDSTQVSKAVMAPNVGRKTNQGGDAKRNAVREVVSQALAPVPATIAPKESIPVSKPTEAVPEVMQKRFKEMMGELRKKVEETCDDVGKDFAEEARKIHYGEAEERGIYGEATLEEAVELHEEGIDIAPLGLPEKARDFDA